jgi:hypothetical protein
MGWSPIGFKYLFPALFQKFIFSPSSTEKKEGKEKSNIKGIPNSSSKVASKHFFFF